MAGSGKTIVLARKAVEIYMAHRDWTIVITYSTRALKNQLVRYISKFYADKNDGEMYDPNKIKVMQAWGSASSVGVYYDVCMHHGLQPLNFTQDVLIHWCQEVIEMLYLLQLLEVKDG